MTTARLPDVLHNMSVPPTSRLTVRRVVHPGRRFRVDLTPQLVGGRDTQLRRLLGERGWRKAWSLLVKAGDGPPRPRGKRTREAFEAHLEAALRQASLPERIGIFFDEGDAGRATQLGPAAALAVLARRSGPLYLPTRPFEPSLVDPRPLVLFFPEESR